MNALSTPKDLFVLTCFVILLMTFEYMTLPFILVSMVVFLFFAALFYGLTGKERE